MSVMERFVRRLCRWLDDRTSHRAGLAVLGDTLAGIGGGFVLPVDRRLGDNVMRMARNQTSQMSSNKVQTGTDEDDCDFWAYCHMSGQPCHWCKGQNALERGVTKEWSDLCQMVNKKAGTAWFGCCRDPQGNARYLAFVDCCGRGYCRIFPPPWKCSNWPQAKNWCYFSGEGRLTGSGSYYCTVVVDMDQEGLCW